MLKKIIATLVVILLVSACISSGPAESVLPTDGFATQTTPPASPLELDQSAESEDMTIAEAYHRTIDVRDMFGDDVITCAETVGFEGWNQPRCWLMIVINEDNAWHMTSHTVEFLDEFTVLVDGPAVDDYSQLQFMGILLRGQAECSTNTGQDFVDRGFQNHLQYAENFPHKSLCPQQR